MTTVDQAGLFPGGTSVSHLTVYDWSTPDGLRGGAAHVHLACTEGYVVLDGRGRLQTLSYEGYAETPLIPLTVAWFGPGVIHRLVNDGGLKVLVVMQNSGLPEAGDSVLTFPSEQLRDPAVYRRAAALPRVPGGLLAEATQERSDLALKGFLGLRERVAADGPTALDGFYADAARLMASQVDILWNAWTNGALAATMRTSEHLAALGRAESEHLRAGRLNVLDPPPDPQYGMCGQLLTYRHWSPRRAGA